MLPWLLLLLLVMSHSARAGELLLSFQRSPTAVSSPPAVVLAMGGHHLHPAPKGTGGDRGSSWLLSPGFFLVAKERG